MRDHASTLKLNLKELICFLLLLDMELNLRRTFLRFGKFDPTWAKTYNA